MPATPPKRPLRQSSNTPAARANAGMGCAGVPPGIGRPTMPDAGGRRLAAVTVAAGGVRIFCCPQPARPGECGRPHA